MNKFLFSMVILAFTACKDAPEQIPAYLNLQPFEVSAAGGTNWQKITDGWLYVNGEFLGAYTLPALVPVLAKGKVRSFYFPA